MSHLDQCVRKMSRTKIIILRQISENIIKDMIQDVDIVLKYIGGPIDEQKTTGVSLEMVWSIWDESNKV